jgi:hypothetical protein
MFKTLATSNTAIINSFLLPLVIGLFTDPQAYLSAHPTYAAIYAAVVMIGSGALKLYQIYRDKQTAPGAPNKPASKVAAHAQPSPHSKRK